MSTAVKARKVSAELSKLNRGHRQAQAVMALGTAGWTSFFSYLAHNAIEKGHVAATGICVVWGGAMAIGGIGFMIRLRSERKLEIAYILRRGPPKGSKAMEEPKRTQVDRPRELEVAKA